MRKGAPRKHPLPKAKDMKNIKTKITAGLIALTTSLTMAQTANADQGKEMVTFGDSFTANGGAPGERAATSPYKRPFRPCFNDKHNWAHQTANNLDHNLADYSCNGTSVWVNQHVDDAIKQGNIGHDTKEVVFMYGGLQQGTYFDALANATLPDVPKASTYRGLLDFQFNKIRKAAPNARITMVNYVPMTVNDTLCVVNHDQLQLPVTIPGATTAEDEFNREIGRAAHDLGVNFINLHDQAKTHDPCQPDTNQRWATLVQTPTAPSVMPLHPTDVGHDGMTQIITRELQNH